METFFGILVLGVIAQQGSCQHPGMGTGGMSLPMLGMAEGMSMQEMMLFQSMLSPSTGTGGGGGGGGGGSGLDPSMLLMLGSGAAGGTDMMQAYAMMNMFGGGADHGQGQQGHHGQQQAGNEQPGIATNIANMLGSSGNPLTVSQQNALWNTVQMSGQAQKIMDAIITPGDRVQLERDGLPNMNPLIQMAGCPRPTNCPMQFCENAEMPFTPESLYMCRGCPRCRLESSQQSMLNMLSQMGGAGSGHVAQMMPQMAMMRSLGGGASVNPAIMMAMRNMQLQQQSQQQANIQQQFQLPRPSPTPQIGPQPQWNPPQGFPTLNESLASQPFQSPPRLDETVPTPYQSSAQLPSNFNAKPPPEFIAAMKAMGSQMRARGAASDTRPLSASL